MTSAGNGHFHFHPSRLSFYILLTLTLISSANAHYIFSSLLYTPTSPAQSTSLKSSSTAVLRPRNNSPIHDVLSPDIRCNVSPGNASEVVEVPAGGRIGFRIDEPGAVAGGGVYHAGPASMYLGRVPGGGGRGGGGVGWRGDGEVWFKIAQWGAAFQPRFTFVSLNEKQFVTTIPRDVPSGEYLARIEHIGLHLTGAPEIFVSCAQIRVVDGGKGTPGPLVKIPGYVKRDDPSLLVNIYWPVPSFYEVPGPKVYKGGSVGVPPTTPPPITPPTTPPITPPTPPVTPPTTPPTPSEPPTPPSPPLPDMCTIKYFVLPKKL